MQAQISSMLDEYRAMRARMEAVTAELAAMTATARSADRSVTATVNPHGELVHLSIDPVLAAKFDLNGLTGRILEAAGLAAVQIRGQLRVKMQQLLPAHLRHLVGPDGAVSLTGLLPEDPTRLGRVWTQR
jgi:DNA-binding protein YbaB